MNKTTLSGPSYQGHYLMGIPGAFGELKSSADLRHDVSALRARMEADGYLYLPGWLDLQRVADARNAMIGKLADEGCLDPAAPRNELAVRADWEPVNQVDWANGVPAIEQLLYEAEMMDFWKQFLGGPVLHYDNTWFRTGRPGSNTFPHVDRVYMGRGTTNLYTAWTPLVDVPYELGGLMILEESHTRGDLLSGYWEMDVDAHCTNDPEPGKVMSSKEEWQRKKAAGYFDQDAIKLQGDFQQRWLSTEFSAGDILVFGMHTLHASSDNHTNRFRLSTDSRYQLASEPADERWVGPNRTGHGPNASKDVIC